MCAPILSFRTCSKGPVEKSWTTKTILTDDPCSTCTTACTVYWFSLSCLRALDQSWRVHTSAASNEIHNWKCQSVTVITSIWASDLPDSLSQKKSTCSVEAWSFCYFFGPTLGLFLIFQLAFFQLAFHHLLSFYDHFILSTSLCFDVSWLQLKGHNWWLVWSLLGSTTLAQVLYKFFLCVAASLSVISHSSQSHQCIM